MSTFNIIILTVFIVFAIIGVALFAGFFGGFGGDGRAVPISVWGTVDGRTISTVLGSGELRQKNKNFGSITYTQKDPRTFEAEFIEALAGGTGPDLVLLPHDLIVSHANKLVVIPHESFSERAFKDTFVEGGEIFLTPDGILGLPFVIDPLVMYWNRSLFSTEGISSPPQYWDEFFLLAPRIIRRDHAANIIQSFVSFGEYSNVTHAKEILSALIMQTGNPIVERAAERGIRSSLNIGGAGAQSGSAEAALRFYTEFSNPVKSTYSWNRALPASRTMFLSGDLALYFGFASELGELRRANPNLNFDVAPFPQSRETGLSSTYGKVSALVIPRTSTNVNAAFSAAVVLSGASAISTLSDLTGLPPVRRDLLAVPPTDAYKSVFYASALQARGFLDPDPDETDGIFKNMVESVTSGRTQYSGAIQTAHAEFSNLLRQ